MMLSPALLGGLAGDAETGTDLGPGATVDAQALDSLGCPAAHPQAGSPVPAPSEP